MVVSFLFGGGRTYRLLDYTRDMKSHLCLVKLSGAYGVCDRCYGLYL